MSVHEELPDPRGWRRTTGRKGDETLTPRQSNEVTRGDAQSGLRGLTEVHREVVI